MNRRLTKHHPTLPIPTKGLNMAKKLRAKFANGVLKPLDKLDLEEGAEVTVSIDDEPELTAEERIEILKSVAGAWEGNSEYWERTKEMLYESRITSSRTARLSAREWLKEVRKHKAASPTRVTSSQILEASDADRR